jgi:large subunit ribosomal protein L21
MTYAIINVGGRQYRVEEGEHLLVERVPHEVGSTFEPRTLLIGGDGQTLLGDELGGRSVTVRVAEHLRGPKVVVGKHRQRTGYRKRNGFRASLTRIQIESIGAAKPARSRSTRAKKAAEAAPASGEE